MIWILLACMAGLFVMVGEQDCRIKKLEERIEQLENGNTTLDDFLAR